MNYLGFGLGVIFGITIAFIAEVAAQEGNTANA